MISRAEKEQTRRKVVEFLKLTGMSNVRFCEAMGIANRTLIAWKKGDACPPPYMSRAIAHLRREIAGEKAAISEVPTCPYCGELIHLSEVARGRFAVSHQCRSGLTIRLMERSREEVLFALTPVIQEGGSNG